MMNAGENLVGIITLLTVYFQKILIAKELSKQHKTKQDIIEVFYTQFKQKYYIDEFILAAKIYSDEEIENAFDNLVKTDEILKTSAMDGKLAMSLLIYKIISKDWNGKNNFRMEQFLQFQG